MKFHLIYTFILATYFVSGQCTNCSNLEQALIRPELVESLDLSNQQISSITKDFNVFKNLKSLNLSFTSIISFEDGVLLPELTSLNCKSTNINPWKINQIGKACPKIEQLNLSNCQLNFIAGGLELFETLKSLDLSNNQLQHLPDELQYLNQLVTLDLSGNQFSNNSNTLGYLWQLQELKINNNPKLKGSSILTTLQLHSKLKTLDIDGEGLLDKQSISMLSKMNINELNIHGLTAEFPLGFQSINSLKKLTFSDCGTVLNKPGIYLPSAVSSVTLQNTSLPLNATLFKQIDTLTITDIEIKDQNQFNKFSTLKVLDLRGASIPKSMIPGIKEQLKETEVISSYIDENKIVPTQLLAAEIKQFTVNSNAPQIIALESVQFDIPKDAFRNQDGSLYNGNATISITELDNPITMALDATPMIYSENGKEEVFRSNGMFRFEAKDSLGKELEPNQNNQIMVTMDNQSPEEKGDLFFYNKKTNNWEIMIDTAALLNRDSLIRKRIEEINKMDAASLVRTNTVDRIFTIRVKTHRYDPTKLSFTSYLPKYSESANQLIYYRKNETGKEMTKFNWVLDTVLDPKMTKLLKSIRIKTKQDFKQTLFKNGTSRNRAAQIWNLSITPDLAHDNYRLNFNFRDTSISIPISLDGSNNRTIQKKYERFERQYRKAQDKDDKNLKLFESKKEKNINEKSSIVRQQMINQAISNITQPNNQQLRFGLSSFGLINCDFFLREKPIKFSILANEVVDQNGNRYQTPASTKVILIDQNSYLETDSKKVPIYKNGIGIIILSATQIGVIQLIETIDKTIKRVKSYDISGKSPKEVNDLIINQP